jgi:hypothetical protein
MIKMLDKSEKFPILTKSRSKAADFQIKKEEQNFENSQKFRQC